MQMHSSDEKMVADRVKLWMYIKNREGFYDIHKVLKNVTTSI